MELIEDSLIPISEFIEEDNLKEALYDYYENGRDSYIESLVEPHIEIRPDPNPCAGGYDRTVYNAYLVSRYGEYITLDQAYIRFAYRDEEFIDFTNHMKRQYPSLKIEVYHYYGRTIINPNPMPGELSSFRPQEMKKFVDPKTGKTYLLRTIPGQGKVFAFTLYGM